MPINPNGWSVNFPGSNAVYPGAPVGNSVDFVQGGVFGGAVGLYLVSGIAYMELGGVLGEATGLYTPGGRARLLWRPAPRIDTNTSTGRYQAGGLLQLRTTINAAFLGTYKPTAAPKILYPYVTNIGTLGERERVTGAPQ